jgi:plasmid stabilization system protein ParE
MAASYGFHPEALFEYAEASNYYLREASPRVAEAFVTAVEFAIAALVAAPERWRIVEAPEIRRYVFSRFPFVIYYRWEPQHERVTIYAVMHCSREPGYWHHRIEQSA